MFDFDDEYKKIILVSEIDPLIGKINIIDIRELEEVQEGTIRTAVHVQMDELASNPSKYMTKEEPYYLLCRSGRRSDLTCRLLEKEGYDVTNIVGGIIAYRGENRI